jgi:uncharacterized membrane protein
MPQIIRRWLLYFSGLSASVVPALLLAAAFGAGARFIAFLNSWIEILVGPVKYWLTIFLGDGKQATLHPMSGLAIGIYLVCLLITFAHPARPCRGNAWLTCLGFAAWYAYAFLAIANVEY